MQKYFFRCVFYMVLICIFIGQGEGVAQLIVPITDYEKLREAVLNHAPRLYYETKPNVLPAVNMLLLKYENLSDTVIDIEDPLKKAIVIRNHVASHIGYMLAGRPANYPVVPFEKIYDNYMFSYDNPMNGHYCGGKTIIFQSILEAFEIPSREVKMFDEIDYDYNSHATAEVFYNGKWIAMDPTFNVMPKYNGEYISYEELRALSIEGKLKDVVWDSNGYYIPDRLKIENYYIGMDKLMNYIAIQKSRVLYQGKIIEYDRKAIPATWDYTLDNGTYLLCSARDNVICYNFSWGEYRFRDMD